MRGSRNKILVVCSFVSIALASMASAAQVTQLQGFFRSGQTFLTWQEVAGTDNSYKVYRSTSPIASPADLTSDKLVATLTDWTSLNLMASINRVALSNSSGPYTIPLRKYLVITEGQPALADTTGLFVYTAKADETAYYAVTAVVSSVEATDVVTGASGNSLSAGIAEVVGPVSAVAQNTSGDYVHWADNVGTVHYGKMNNRPSVPYNFRVHAPTGAGPYPQIGVLHGALFQFDTPDADRWAKLDGAEGNTAVRISMDCPLMQGTIANLMMPDSLSESWTNDNATRRVLWTLDWVKTQFPVDDNRVSLRGESAGGLGTLYIGTRNPDRFAALHPYVPVLSSTQSYINARPTTEFPFILMTCGRLDQIVGWPDKVTFSTSEQNNLQPFIFYWDGRWHSYTTNTANYPLPPVWGEPGSGGREEMPLTSFSRVQSYPALANLTVNNDPGTVNLATPPASRPPLNSPGVGDLVGTINGAVDWNRNTIVDTVDSYGITLNLMSWAGAETATASVTPRRLQNFNPAVGTSYPYRVINPVSRAILDTGSVQPNANGHLQVNNVPLSKTATRLEIGVLPTEVQSGAWSEYE